VSHLLSSALSPFTLVIALFVLSFILIAGFLVWYALRRNDEVRAKFGHGKTTFEIETKKRSSPP
jgi:predicted membrane metal-binding protein